MYYLKTVPYPGSGLDRVWGVSSAALCARSLSVVMESGRCGTFRRWGLVESTEVMWKVLMHM